MATSVAIVKNYLQRTLNPSMSVVSSLGSFNTTMDEQISNDTRKMINQYGCEKSKAICNGTEMGHFSEKQIWCMAYDLANTEMMAIVEKESKAGAELESRQRAAQRQRRANAQARKDAFYGIERIDNDSLKAQLKEAKQTKKAYEEWLKASSFKSEYYSKNYSQNSLNAFLNA